ncbi:hypothetical protein CONCODRAFT_12571 [Conidiobolus coronatus NRRL 28638]|uniref:Uncharacterized protein n=1 Tax=Conidiobolus coronatus (strain ATCC 28846 / CBS 209.66 / NRRL 28638) TaxID=796925 RepID=A0A137NSQ8_CONC2|nr:hypothetical protein CONCODRAFT_12571 [Conidiobolus coronatus NRRL 28638]|eukprot:KXN65751.1 hypothetical protein CONCODRAFT_12571 [Conidiobolus coronatus NRRL 28638]
MMYWKVSEIDKSNKKKKKGKLGISSETLKSFTCLGKRITLELTGSNSANLHLSCTDKKQASQIANKLKSCSSAEMIEAPILAENLRKVVGYTPWDILSSLNCSVQQPWAAFQGHEVLESREINLDHCAAESEHLTVKLAKSALILRRFNIILISLLRPKCLRRPTQVNPFYPLLQLKVFVKHLGDTHVNTSQITHSLFTRNSPLSSVNAIPV